MTSFILNVVACFPKLWRVEIVGLLYLLKMFHWLVWDAWWIFGEINGNFLAVHWLGLNFDCRGCGFISLVGELRSHKLSGANNNKNTGEIMFVEEEEQWSRHRWTWLSLLHWSRVTSVGALLYFSLSLFFLICSGFCHTLKWNSHGFTCVPHHDPPSHLPLHPLPLGFPVHQVRALVSCIQPGLVICFTLDNIHVSMLFSWNIPPSPSPTESKSLFCTSVSFFFFLFCI